MPRALRYRLEGPNGVAVGVDGDRLVGPDGSFDLTLSLGDGELRPGLINAHEHLHRNHYGRLGTPPYPNAYAWGRHIHRTCLEEIGRGRAVDRAEALQLGALKNLLGGATTVVHHDPWEPAFERCFPIRLARVRGVHSLGFEPGLEGARGGDPSLPLSIHLAEGTTPEDADEIRKLADLGLLDDRMIAVHVVGADPDGIRRLREARVAIVWCPTSNEFLFGRSVSPELLASGVDVLLGSDSLLTADGTLLDELRAARAHRVLDDGELLDAVGNVAARRLDLPRPELSPQAPADLAYFAKPVLQATATDVELVVVAGLPRLADERFGDLFACAGVKTEPLRVGATDKLVAAPLASVAGRVLGRCPAAPFWTSVRQRLP